MKRLAVLLLVALVAAACSGKKIAGDQGLLRLDGTATITDADGTTETVTDDVTVELGDVIALTGGSAVLELADGSTYELRLGADGSPATQLTMSLPPTLLAGDVLVADGFPADLRFDTVVLTAQGAAAVDAETAQVTAYAGRTTLTGVADVDDVSGLRSLVVVPPGAVQPVAYDGTDGWDRRFLGEAIAFGERLEALARGYTNELRDDSDRSASFFQSVIPALDTEREFNDGVIQGRSVGETLIGAAIAVQGRQGTFSQRWSEIFAFRDAGAAWGLVALDQGVSSEPVLDTIEVAVEQSPISGQPAATTPPTAPPPSTSPPTTQPPGGGPQPPPPTTTTTEPPPPPEDDEGLLSPAVDPVGEVVGDIIDALGLDD